MSIQRMNDLQYRRTRKLVHHCCNYCGGNCLLLDDGEACICVQETSRSLLCRGYREKVLPLAAEWHEEIGAAARILETP